MSDIDLPSKLPYQAVSENRPHHRPRRKLAASRESADGEFVVPTALPRQKPAVPVVAAQAQAQAQTQGPAPAETEDFLPQPGRKPQVPVNARAETIKEYAGAARSAARIAQVPFADVLAKAGQESNYNARARSSSSSAAGPYQFIEQTWLDMLKRHGAAYGLGPEVAQIKSHNGVATVADPAVRKRLLDLRHDIHLSAGMAARYLDESGRDLGRMLHRKPSDDEKRIAYFLGPGGAAKLIRAAMADPAGLASDVVPQAADANRSLFYGPAGALTNRDAMQRITRFVTKNLNDAAAMAESEKPVISDRMAEGSGVA